jgi:hypothetical protein
MGTSPKGLGPENDCPGEGKQQVHTTDRLLVREQACNCLTVIKIWSNTSDGCFIPRQTGRLTVSRNIRLRLRLNKFELRELDYSVEVSCRKVHCRRRIRSQPVKT